MNDLGYTRTATVPAIPTPRRPEAAARRTTDVAVLGLGYVGLPTLISLAERGRRVHGVDISADRVRRVQHQQVELLPHHLDGLARALDSGLLTVDTDPARLAEADAVVICVPTPIDDHLMPDLGPLAAACRTAVEAAVPGQVLILTSTTYVGCTEDLLVAPLRGRGLEVGTDVHVCFSPERIDPGTAGRAPELTPRVIGGATPACLAAGVEALTGSCLEFHEVGSAEAAEFTKLLENTFRAVNIAFANEMADLARSHALDIAEIIDAAATKPYGFLRFDPGPGVGGHCIPCDPHYLLHTARQQRVDLPITGSAMTGIALRPGKVVQRIRDLLGDAGVPLREARVHLWGTAYKPGIADVREAPALRVIEELLAAGTEVTFSDSHVGRLTVAGRTLRAGLDAVAGADLVVVMVVHPGESPVESTVGAVLDTTYKLPTGDDRIVRL